MWLVRGRSIGATVTHLPSRVTYFQVSVVDQVLVLDPREPPDRHAHALGADVCHGTRRTFGLTRSPVTYTSLFSDTMEKPHLLGLGKVGSWCHRSVDTRRGGEMFSHSHVLGHRRNRTSSEHHVVHIPPVSAVRDHLTRLPDVCRSHSQKDQRPTRCESIKRSPREFVLFLIKTSHFQL